MNKPALTTKRTCWVILTLPWPLYELHQQSQDFQFFCNCHNCFHLLMDLTRTWTKQNHYITGMLDDSDMTLTLTRSNSFNFVLIVITFSLIDGFNSYSKQHLWHEWHVGWFWLNLDIYMTWRTRSHFSILL